MTKTVFANTTRTLLSEQIHVAGSSLRRDKFFYAISNPHGNHCNKSNVFPYILFIKY